MSKIDGVGTVLAREAGEEITRRLETELQAQQKWNADWLAATERHSVSKSTGG